nr:MAG TPA: hypothetical protein [Caudoviricetes sp.]
MKTIQELCVHIAVVENQITAEKGNGFSLEEKKAISTTLSLLFSKKELLEGLAFCYGSFEDEILTSNDNWNPSQSIFYTITNILLHLLGMKTFKQCSDWREVYKTIAKRLFY